MQVGRRLCHLAAWRSTSAVVWTTRRAAAASGVDRTSIRATATSARVTGRNAGHGEERGRDDDDDDEGFP